MTLEKNLSTEGQYASVHQNTHRNRAVTKLLNRYETLCRLLAAVCCDPFSQLVTLLIDFIQTPSLFHTSSTSAHNNADSISSGMRKRSTTLTVLLLGCKMFANAETCALCHSVIFGGRITIRGGRGYRLTNGSEWSISIDVVLTRTCCFCNIQN